MAPYAVHVACAAALLLFTVVSHHKTINSFELLQDNYSSRLAKQLRDADEALASEKGNPQATGNHSFDGPQSNVEWTGQSFGNQRDVFLNYLRQVRSTYDKHANTTFVIGEEACDVDTIVSSIVYAFYRTKLDGEKLFVPLLNCRPQQLRLKSELVAILRRDALGELLLVNEVPQQELKKRPLIIVGNSHPSSFFLTSSQVIGFLSNDEVPDDKKAILAEAAATTSAVVAKVISNSDDKDSTEFDYVKSLLIYTILLITENLTTPDALILDRQSVNAQKHEYLTHSYEALAKFRNTHSDSSAYETQLSIVSTSDRMYRIALVAESQALESIHKKSDLVDVLKAIETRYACNLVIFYNNTDVGIIPIDSESAATMRIVESLRQNWRAHQPIPVSSIFRGYFYRNASRTFAELKKIAQQSLRRAEADLQLNTFVKQTAMMSLSPSEDHKTVFVGTAENCSIDSIVGAIATSFLFTRAMPPSLKEHFKGHSTVFLPVVTCEPSLLRLKREVSNFLAANNIDYNNLTFMSDVLVKHPNLKNASYISVNKNVPANIPMEVLFTIDETGVHGKRIQENFELNLTTSTSVILQLVGTEIDSLNAAFYDFIRGPIVLNTGDMRKAKPEETHMVARMMPALQTRFFRTISFNKDNFAGMTVHDMLIKDVLVENNGPIKVGFPFLPIPVLKYLNTLNAEHTIRQFIIEHELDAMVLYGRANTTSVLVAKDDDEHMLLFKRLQDLLRNAVNSKFEELDGVPVKNCVVLKQIDKYVTRSRFIKTFKAAGYLNQTPRR